MQRTSSFSARSMVVLAVGVVAPMAAARVRADTGPVFVVRNRPGVPVPINGRDASWHVVDPAD